MEFRMVGVWGHLRNANKIWDACKEQALVYAKILIIGTDVDIHRLRSECATGG